MRTLTGIILCLLYVLPAIAAPTPIDFAWGFRVEANAGAPIYRVPLNESVYESIGTLKHADLAVFNSSDEAVPWLLETKAFEPRTDVKAMAVPYFPIQRLAGTNFSAQVRVDVNGAIVNIAPRAAANTVTAHYLLDLSGLDSDVSELVLAWAEESEDFVTKLRIEASEDLSRWRRVAKGIAIAHLAHGDNRLRRNQLRLPAVRAKYLRLTPADSGSLPVLTAATVRPGRRSAEPNRNWTIVPGTADATRPGVYNFTARGYLPVNQVKVYFPQNNTYARASLWSRASSAAPWSRRHNGAIYDLESATVRLRSDPIETVVSGHRYWQLRIDNESGGIGAGVPELHLGWTPTHLVFVARGQGPFTLAAGSGSVMVAQVSAGPLRDAFSRRGNTVRSAALSARFPLGGENALQAAKKPTNWKQIGLWAVLILGVLVLGWMAASLYRQMSPGSPEDEADPGESSP